MRNRHLGREIAYKFCRRRHFLSSTSSSDVAVIPCSTYQPHRVTPSNSTIKNRMSSQKIYGESSIIPHTFNNTIIERFTKQYKSTIALRCKKINPRSDCNIIIYDQIRLFQNVSQYHDVADGTLHTIQDAIEDFIEDNFDTDTRNSDDEIPEVNYASGVLTLSFPPHGTWVINKQTPNQQLWWSSPLSGPRRYEYAKEREKWVYTRVIEGSDEGSAQVTENCDEDTLGGILAQELKEIYGWNLQVEA